MYYTLLVAGIITFMVIMLVLAWRRARKKDETGENFLQWIISGKKSPELAHETAEAVSDPRSSNLVSTKVTFMQRVAKWWNDWWAEIKRKRAEIRLQKAERQRMILAAKFNRQKAREKSKQRAVDAEIERKRLKVEGKQNRLNEKLRLRMQKESDKIRLKADKLDMLKKDKEWLRNLPDYEPWQVRMKKFFDRIGKWFDRKARERRERIARGEPSSWQKFKNMFKKTPPPAPPPGTPPASDGNGKQPSWRWTKFKAAFGLLKWVFLILAILVTGPVLLLMYGGETGAVIGSVLLIGIGIALTLWLATIRFASPRPGTAQTVTIFNRISNFIHNIDSVTIDEKSGDFVETGNAPNGINLYPLIWPMAIYKYPITYTRKIGINEVRPTDTVLYDIKVKGEDGTVIVKEVVVSRSNISDHIRYVEEYPTITTQLDTKELATITTYTNVVLQAVNMRKMLSGSKIGNYLTATMNTIHAALRGLIGNLPLQTINEGLRSEANGDFNSEMQKVNADDGQRIGIGTWGVKINKASFMDFEPGNEKAKMLMDAYANVEIEEQVGLAASKKAEGQAAAIRKVGNAKIDIEVSELMRTGLAGEFETVEEEREGKKVSVTRIKSRLPDPNTKVVMDNIGALKDLKGTLVLGDDVTKIINLNQQKKEVENEELVK